MRTVFRALLAGVLCSSMGVATAVPTAAWSMIDPHAYGTAINFDTVGTLADNTAVTDQFASLGVRFSGSLRANGCGSNTWALLGMQDNSLASFGPDCSANTVNDAFAMKFDRLVSKLALDARLSDPTRIATLDLYRQGALVAAFSMPDLAYSGLALDETVQTNGRFFSNTAADRIGILQIGGASFDEIRFSENAFDGQTGFLIFDNLRFDVAPADVPEPASLGLLALGLAGIGAMRRKPKGACA